MHKIRANYVFLSELKRKHIVTDLFSVLYWTKHDIFPKRTHEKHTLIIIDEYITNTFVLIMYGIIENNVILPELERNDTVADLFSVPCVLYRTKYDIFKKTLKNLHLHQ